MDFQTEYSNFKDSSWLGLTLTSAAVTHIKSLINKRSDILGIRLLVEPAGCAGLCYVLDTVSKPEKDDLLFETNGARLYVPIQAMPFIDGTKIDFVQDGFNNLLKFNNPKAKNKCGCGASFVT